jgi:hypothetical protein
VSTLFAKAAALVAAGALGLTGCAGSTTPTRTPSATVSISASPTPSLTESQKAANDTVIKYRALIDELRQQETPDTARVATIARASAYENALSTLIDDFRNGHRQVGLSILTILSTDPGVGSGEWKVTGCLDLSKVDILDKSGKSIRTDTQNRYLSTFTVDQDPQNHSWYVMSDEANGTC